MDLRDLIPITRDNLKEVKGKERKSIEMKYNELLHEYKLLTGRNYEG